MNPRRCTAPRRHGWLVLLAGSCLMAIGCGYSGGELLYLLGLGRAKLVGPEFQLTDEPILVLVDDAGGRIDWPLARRHLTDQLAQELIKNEAASKIIPIETLDHLRQSDPSFEGRGCREVGRRAGASQVLWVEVQDFLAEPRITSVSQAGYFGVTVKVINTMEKNRARVRLWPTSPAGHRVVVTLSGSEVSTAGTRDAISRELSRRLAGEIAKLFYEHRPGDFESRK